MKKTLFSLILIAGLFPILSHGQLLVPNGDFEDWTSGNPDLWFTPNSILGAPVTEVAGNGGGSAARGDVMYIALAGENVPGALLFMGDGANLFPVDENWNYLVFDYKFHSEEGDQLLASATMTDAAMADAGYAIFSISEDATEFTTMSIPVVYSGTAADCALTFLLYNENGEVASVGTYFVIDNVYLSNTATSVVDADNHSPLSAIVYPNPANESCQVKVNLPVPSAIELVLTDGLGNVVLHMQTAQQSAGPQQIELDTFSLAGGLYTLQLRTNSGNQVMRLHVAH